MPYFPAPKDDNLPPTVAGAVIGWARIPPARARAHPGYPTEWTPVLECDPTEPDRAPLGGWLFLYENGRVREVEGQHFEIVKGPERPKN